MTFPEFQKVPGKWRGTLAQIKAIAQMFMMWDDAGVFVEELTSSLILRAEQGSLVIEHILDQVCFLCTLF
jgi:hypothetical protein